MIQTFLNLTTLSLCITLSSYADKQQHLIKDLTHLHYANGGIARNDCTYLTVGKYNLNNANRVIYYRVGFTLFEIYHNIIIERMEVSDGECDGSMPKIGDVIEIDGIQLAEQIGLKNKGEFITDLQFIKWNDWNVFTLKIHGKLVKFKILDDMNIELLMQ